MGLQHIARQLGCLVLGGLGMLALIGDMAQAQAAPQPMTVVVFGDSQAQGVAAALERVAVRDRHLHIVDKTVAGTALSQKQPYDWVSVVNRDITTVHPDVAVLMFGGNDRLAVRVEAGGKAFSFKSTTWRNLYAERVSAVVDALKKAHVRTIWLGQPVARDAEYTKDMEFLNGVFAEVVPRDGADYVPLWNVATDSTGAYTAYGPGPDGRTTRLRQDDGVHFMPAGYDLIVGRLRDHLDAPTKGARNAVPVKSAGTTGLASRS